MVTPVGKHPRETGRSKNLTSRGNENTVDNATMMVIPCKAKLYTIFYLKVAEVLSIKPLLAATRSKTTALLGSFFLRQIAV